MANLAPRAAVGTPWIQELAIAQEKLHSAIEHHDAKPLKEAAWCLHRVLNLQPSRINARLNQVAHHLPLLELVQDLTVVRDHMIQTHLDRERVRQFHEFEKGIDELARLDEKLTTCVSQHDQWQEVDVELRLIQDNMERDMAELELSWLSLQDKAASLYSSSAEEWARQLRAESEGLRNAILAQNLAQMKKHFRKYHWCAEHQFNRVDQDLKMLCEQLRIIGAPLSSVLGMLQ